MGDSEEALPPRRLLARGPNGIVLYQGVPKPERSTGGLKIIPGEKMAISPDGKLLAVLTGDAITLYDTASETEISKLEIPGIVGLFFSPKSSHLTTVARPEKGAGNADKNLKVWRIPDWEVVLQLHQKSVTKDQWPCIHWTSDESMAYQMVTNAVNGYRAGAFDQGIAQKLYMKGINSFAIAPGTGDTIAAYVPEVKSAPASVAVYSVAALPSSGTEAPAPLARRNFFRSSSASFAWSPTGVAVVVTAISEVDASNQSYYGEQKLHFLSADGSIEQAVPLEKDGPIHDVKWSPRGDLFVVVHGFMPAKVLLFNDKCKPVYNMGSGPYGLAEWNPQGRFLALGGFGNLSGDVMFLDKKADSKCKPIANVKARDTVIAEWSPCGRYFMTATTSPRLRVDNGYRIWKYDGTLVHEEKMEVLLEMAWLPAPPDVFPDRPQSPRKEGDAPKAARPASLAPVPQAAGYVPPHLRGREGAAPSSSANFSLAYDPSDKMGRPGPRQAASNLPPGAAPPESKAASKNAKRRANRKKAAAGDEEGQQQGAGGSGAAAAPAAEMATLQVSEPAADPAKRIKNLKKKLSQVQQLKEKRDKEGEAALDPDQIKKIATENSIREEILSLGGEL